MTAGRECECEAAFAEVGVDGLWPVLETVGEAVVVSTEPREDVRSSAVMPDMLGSPAVLLLLLAMSLRGMRGLVCSGPWIDGPGFWMRTETSTMSIDLSSPSPFDV